MFMNLKERLPADYTFNYLGDIIPGCTQEKIEKGILSANLARYTQCFEKASIVQNILKDIYPEIQICTGEIDVYDPKGNSFGFDFNPPLSCHCWNVINGEIIDYGLSGVIEAGLIGDQDGPFLHNIKPVVLAGCCPSWIKYKMHKYVVIG